MRRIFYIWYNITITVWFGILRLGRWATRSRVKRIMAQIDPLVLTASERKAVSFFCKLAHDAYTIDNVKTVRKEYPRATD